MACTQFRIEVRQTFAESESFLHATLHHAASVSVVATGQQFDLLREDAMSLFDAQLPHVLHRICMFHGEEDRVDRTFPHVLRNHV